MPPVRGVGSLNDNVKDMTTGKPMKLILLFALPLMLGNIGQQLYTVVDAVIVGQGIGVEALAALGATDWLYWLFLWSMTSFAQGFSIQLSQRFGAKDSEGLRGAFTMSMLLSAIIGVTFTVLGVVLAEPLLRLLGTPTDIFDDALLYLRTLSAGSVVVMAYSMSGSVLRSLGDGKTPLIGMIIASIVNIGLDLLFVMVFHWGIVGAAVATLIAQLLSFLYCWRAIRRIEILRTEKSDWRPNAAIIKRLLGLGTPLAVQHAIIAVGGMIMQSVLNGFGFVFLAGFTATNKLYGILESTAVSFGYSMSTYMGQNLGAKKPERIDEGMRAVLKLAVGVALTIGAVMILVGKSILRLFVSQSDPNAPQVLEVAYQYLVIMSALLVILYLLHAYRSSLQGLGNTMAPLLSGILEFFMRVGVALIIPQLVGEFGIFFAEPAAWAGAAIVLIISYYREVKRVKRRLAGEIRQEVPDVG